MAVYLAVDGEVAGPIDGHQVCADGGGLGLQRHLAPRQQRHLAHDVLGEHLEHLTRLTTGREGKADFRGRVPGCYGG